MRVIYLLLVMMWPASAIGAEADKPPLPFESWGSCPFECCTYREWKATQAVTVYSERDTKGPTAFVVKKGEWVHGVDGVVVTYRAGVSKILKPMELGYPETDDKDPLPLQPKLALRLQAGDLLYPLHYTGEGSYLFWYKGKLYTDEVSAKNPDPDPPPPELNIQVVITPKYVWWARIRNKVGVTGWTTEVHKFSNVDACG
jgi:hypothetical protein